MFQVKPGEIKLEMDQARSKVVPFPTGNRRHLRLKFRRYPMSNMSYCRFQNTYGEAPSVWTHWKQQKELSGDEYNAARNMFLEFLRFCVDMEIIEDFDKERFGEYLGELRTGRD